MLCGGLGTSLCVCVEPLPAGLFATHACVCLCAAFPHCRMVPESEGGVLWPHYHCCDCDVETCKRHRPLGCADYYESMGYSNPRYGTGTGTVDAAASWYCSCVTFRLLLSSRFVCITLRCAFLPPQITLPQPPVCGSLPPQTHPIHMRTPSQAALPLLPDAAGHLATHQDLKPPRAHPP